MSMSPPPSSDGKGSVPINPSPSLAGVSAATSLEVAINTIEGLQSHIANCNDTIVDLKVRCDKMEGKVRNKDGVRGGA